MGLISKFFNTNTSTKALPPKIAEMDPYMIECVEMPQKLCLEFEAFSYRNNDKLPIPRSAAND